MTSLHSDLVETNLHRAFHYEQDADPGAVGAGKYWLDTNSGPPRLLWRRNAGNAGWDAVGASGAAAAATQIDETGGPTTLDIAAIADGEYLRRSGTDIIGDTPSSGSNADTPPVSPNAMDDEFDDTAGMSGTVNGLNARWAWRNQSTSTITFVDGVAIITPPASASRNIRIIEQTQPAAQDYTIEAKIGITHNGNNFSQVALALIDGVNGDFYWFPIAVSASNALGTAVNLMTNVTTFASTPLAGGAWHSQVAYFKIEYVNSTDVYTFYISPDRKSYYRLGSVTDAVGVTKVGVGIDEETNTGFPKLNVYWFRRTA